MKNEYLFLLPIKRAWEKTDVTGYDVTSDKDKITCFLNSYLLINSCVISIEQQRKHLIAHLDKLDKPGSTAELQNTESRIKSINQQFDSDIEKLIERGKAISALIDSLWNDNVRLAMRFHYINGNTWEKTAELCYISVRSAQNYNAKAVDSLLQAARLAFPDKPKEV